MTEIRRKRSGEREREREREEEREKRKGRKRKEIIERKRWKGMERGGMQRVGATETEIEKRRE